MNKEQIRRRDQKVNFDREWKNKNPFAWAIVETFLIVSVMAVIITYIVVALTPHPQQVNLSIHCGNFILQPNIAENGLNVNNCTAEANIIVWISEQQIISNKTGLP